MWVRMMAQVNLARSSLFRDQRNFAIQFSLEICTANFISNSRNLEVGIFLSSVTWSSFLQLTYKVRCALVRFWNRSYAFRPNLTPLSSVTIIYQNNIKFTILDERPLVFGILVDQITTYATPQGLQLFCTKNCLPSTKCKEYCLRNSRRYHVSICKMDGFKNSFFSQKLYVDAFT